MINKNVLEKYNFAGFNQTNTEFTATKSTSKNLQNAKIYDYTLNKLRAIKSIVSSNKDDIEYRNYIIRKHKIEWHRKIALAIACIILFLIGAPLGTIIRKGGFGMPVMVSVFFFVFYHVINITGEKAAKESTLTPSEGMWLANFVFLPIAIFLIYKTSRNITLSNIGRYTNPISKLFIKQ